MNTYTRLGFLLPLTLPLLLVLSFYLGLWYVVPLLVFGVVPVLDRLLMDKLGNPSKAEQIELQKDGYFSWVLYTYVLLHGALISWAVTVSSGLGWSEVLLLATSVAVITGGIGIPVSHELGHRRSTLDKLLTCFLLSSVSYLHFLVEHNKGHHSRVATPEDPLTARFGESVYRFLPRSLIGAFMSAWAIEKKRLRGVGRSPISLRNHMLWAVAGPVIITSLLALSFGVKAGLLFMIQCLVAILLAETTNYIEHYGLQRKRDASGRYEKVNHTHSWNSNRCLGNLVLFNLQRHAHHHMDVRRHYQCLQWFEDSPQLPRGYAELVLTAWIPPLWRYRMHPLLASAQSQEGTKPILRS